MGAAMDPIQVAETLVLLLGVAVALNWLSGRIGVPYPVALVLAGIGLGFIPAIPEVKLDPQLVLMLFVAPLLFADAFFAPVAELMRNARSIVLLASVLVGVTAGVVAAAAHFVLDLPWDSAFALGAALAATDSVAPIQVLGREGADPRLVGVIQGESLLNDGVAFTLVKVASAAVVTGSFSLLSATGSFALSIAGGLVVGFAVGAVVVELRRRTSDTIVEATLSLMTPLAAYVAAEAVHGSGILAAVAAGLWMGPRSRTQVEPLTRVEVQAAWKIIGYLLNSLLFLLVGLQVDDVVNAVSLPLGDVVLGAVAILVGLVGIRVLWALMLPSAWQGVKRLVGRSEPTSTKGWRFALAWSGVRGSLALAAALSLPAQTDAGDPFPGRDLILLMTLIVIVATLVFQGLTLRPLLRSLGLTDREAVAREEAHARARAAEAALERLDEVAGRHELPDRSRKWLEREYEWRRDRFTARVDNGGSDDLEDRHKRVAAADSELLEAARAAVVELEAAGDVRSEVAQKVLRDLDLDTARIGDAAGPEP
ncbi:MAG: monovalent cation/hydrogen antiporter [Thermoleophilaceae bacterium]|nr:monovalent cation/hydrogen antiporter [Thermoleophilaceae bacterium]